MQQKEGKLLLSKKTKIGIILSRFNNFYSERLLEGALDAIKRTGGDESNIDVYKVPGSFEIPMTLKKMVSLKKYDGILTLGVIIRGETPHFDYIAAETTKGIAQVALQSDIPITYGIVTADTLDQATDRAGTKMGNKGFDAAISLIEMINLYQNEF
jgi:6,7-dimethyl-8-ribityllumazine synthase